MAIVARIMYKDKKYRYYGRNGGGNCTGINVIGHTNHIALYPMNSRGFTSNCMIPIPKEEIDNLIESLQKLK